MDQTRHRRLIPRSPSSPKTPSATSADPSRSRRCHFKSSRVPFRGEARTGGRLFSLNWITRAPRYIVVLDLPVAMATVLAKDPTRKGDESASTLSLQGVPPLGAPKEEKRFWFQRDKHFDPLAVATQVFSPTLDTRDLWQRTDEGFARPASSTTPTLQRSISHGMTGEHAATFEFVWF